MARPKGSKNNKEKKVNKNYFKKLLTALEKKNADAKPTK